MIVEIFNLALHLSRALHHAVHPQALQTVCAVMMLAPTKAVTFHMGNAQTTMTINQPTAAMETPIIWTPWDTILLANVQSKKRAGSTWTSVFIVCLGRNGHGYREACDNAILASYWLWWVYTKTQVESPSMVLTCHKYSKVKRLPFLFANEGLNMPWNLVARFVDIFPRTLITKCQIYA